MLQKLYLVLELIKISVYISKTLMIVICELRKTPSLTVYLTVIEVVIMFFITKIDYKLLILLERVIYYTIVIYDNILLKTFIRYFSWHIYNFFTLHAYCISIRHSNRFVDKLKIYF